MELLTGYYGSPFHQADGWIDVCLSVPSGVGRESYIHIRGMGETIQPGPQVEIEGFEPKEALGICDGSCREDSSPNNLKQMRPIPADLVDSICALPDYLSTLLSAPSNQKK